MKNNHELIYHELYREELKKFLTTGRLGQLNEGPSTKEVENALGEPLSIDYSQNAVPDKTLKILYFSNLEFVYLDDEFYKLAIRFGREKECGFPDKLEARWYTSLSNIDYRTFVAFVNLEDVKCREVDFSSPPEESGYAIEVIASKIHVIFDLAPLSKIYSIHYELNLSGIRRYKPLPV